MADPPGYTSLPPPIVPITGEGSGRITEVWYSYLIGLEARLQLALAGTITPITDDLETLRVALNEVRGDPPTVFPDVPPFT